ncbi:inorganic phosphate transporter [Rhizobium sp. ARZ01]|uniref:inorganic phosphate transporter n=1 Tax=Rhizobium sp. ARZ01 TaxID=2769313 RepID=UPI0017824460|nr:inorganic phosphate transporter [Rhizobium sp. ARZ01]MBD9371171.1 inorganic phosphate transporter [Rhizobium sp. ARZ01]
MDNTPTRLGKPTLDKDLDKLTRLEEATHFISRGLLAPGIGLIFLALAMIVAAAFVIDRPGAAVIIAAAALAAYMAMNIGANDVANNVSPAVGSRALTMTAALVIAAVFETLGALLAGGDVVSTVSEGIVGPASMPPDTLILAMLAALLSAAVWINVATWLGAPISTTHAIVGAVMGAGIAAAGAASVDWKLMSGIATSWVASPLLGGVIAALLLFFIKETIIYRDDKIAAARRWVPGLVGLMSGSFVAYLSISPLDHLLDLSLGASLLLGLAAGMATYAASVPFIARQSIGLDNRNQSLRKLFRVPLIISAALLSFAHGANDVANAIGPLAAIVHAAQTAQSGFDHTLPLWVMLIGALGISLGLLLFGPKLIELVGKDITKLNPMRAYCVALSAAVTVLVASAFGMPVSSTHIAVGSVFGVGFFREWYTRNSRRRLDYIRKRGGIIDVEELEDRNPDEIRRRRLVRRSHFMTIVAAWIITVPLTAMAAAILFTLLNGLFG